jgi:virginiamycin B lyase
MNRRLFLASSAVLLATPSRTVFGQESPFHVKYFSLAAGVGVHDVAPARDGSVWFTCQQAGTLGRFVPDDGSTI